MHYVRPEYRAIWKEFFRLAKKDKDIQREKSKCKVGSPNVDSIALTMLVFNYVRIKNPEFTTVKIEDNTNETPH